MGTQSVKCPLHNAELLMKTIDGRWASWGADFDLPICTKCTSEDHCSGNAASVTAAGSECKCTCKPGWTGDYCREVDLAVAVPSGVNEITICNRKACSYNGEGVVTPSTMSCTCECDDGFAGSRCERCARGYGPEYPKCAAEYEQTGKTCAPGMSSHFYLPSAHNCPRGTFDLEHLPLCSYSTDGYGTAVSSWQLNRGSWSHTYRTIYASSMSDCFAACVAESH